MWVQGDDFGYCARGLSKFTDVGILLSLPFPVEILAKIASYRDGWCGATESDCYELIKMWQDFKPNKLQF
jgi:hypothetical protein